MAGLVSSMSTVSGTVGQCLAKEGEGVCVGGGVASQCHGHRLSLLSCCHTPSGRVLSNTSLSEEGRELETTFLLHELKPAEWSAG